MSKKRQALLAVGIVVLILIADQCLKIWVKTHMYYGESISIVSWFQLKFIENNGMAFGWELGGKYLLTSFRLVAIIAITIYLVQYIRRGGIIFFVIALSMILAGAVGNVIDCMVYGQIFNDPMPPQVAELMPWGTGYESVMLGRVVDMLYFPLLEWDMPNVAFLPYAGEHCVFFSPIFNIADASVSCAVILLLGYFLCIKKK